VYGILELALNCILHCVLSLRYWFYSPNIAVILSTLEISPFDIVVNHSTQGTGHTSVGFIGKLAKTTFLGDLLIDDTGLDSQPTARVTRRNSRDRSISL
jgi:hypothetical protein